MHSILHRRELLAGLLVLALGLVCLAAVGDAEIGTIAEMGPGYVPRALAVFLIAAGIGIAAIGARRQVSEAVTIAWRPVLLIGASLAVFGALVDHLGIVIAVVASTLLAAFASPISRHRETPWLAIGLAALAAIAFVKGLGLAIPVWPR